MRSQCDQGRTSQESRLKSGRILAPRENMWGFSKARIMDQTSSSISTGEYAHGVICLWVAMQLYCKCVILKEGSSRLGVPPTQCQPVPERFIRFSNFDQRFFNHLSTITLTLYDLKKSNTQFVWTEEQYSSFKSFDACFSHVHTNLIKRPLTCTSPLYSNMNS